ncbi:unnamed protein product [Caenorhabditis angaria]|uniref:Phosphate transporter n=1 Tax=Caenorhabditis angaria TaxID=860376 RepID=A0A9P1IZC1_9PELO|nr:unnamed protein product [Caenorhabditis angaria]
MTSSTEIYFTNLLKPVPYYNLEVVQWALIFGVSFILGIGLGANDVADAFGTAVGAGTLTVTQAFVLASVVEMMGSVASGLAGNGGVSLQIIDTQQYAMDPEELVLGHLAMLIGCSVWLIIATFYGMPVSSIHSILGATIGFSLVLKGFTGIIWYRVVHIVVVWLISPFLSAIFSLLIFFTIDFAILRRENPVQRGLFYLPLIYLIVIFTNVLLFLLDGSQVLHLSDVPVAYMLAVSLIVGSLAGFFALFLVGPIMKQRLRREKIELPRIESSLSYTKNDSSLCSKLFPRDRKDDQKSVRLFSLLQIITACFAGFAHGADDVSNSVGPIRDLVHFYNQSYQDDNTTLNISVYIGLLSTLAILLGIWSLGIRVIKTVGEEISKMNPATGFSVEFGAAIVALGGNAIDIPQSMTHCLVGSIIGLGIVRSGPPVQWKTVKYVFMSWVLTMPVSGAISALSIYLMKRIFFVFQVDS